MRQFSILIVLILAFTTLYPAQLNAQKKRRSTKSAKIFKPKKGFVGQPIDLGLSVKWSSWELDASKPEEQGGSYAWGETTQRDPRDWKNITLKKYKFYNSTIGSFIKYYHYKENDSIYSDYNQHTTIMSSATVHGKKRANTDYGLVGDVDSVLVVRLDLTDDIARIKWGEHWRIPTSEEVKELYTMCKWEKVGSLITGEPCGWRVTGPNGNSIFMPGINKKDLGNEYSGSILSSDSPIRKIDSCYGLSYNSYNPIYERYDRYLLFSIRPVYVE